jgi:hypothetical protein
MLPCSSSCAAITAARKPKLSWLNLVPCINPERRMKYAKAILGSIALFVLLDILISVMNVIPSAKVC